MSIDGQLIVLESTTYPGTTEEIVVPLLEAGNLLGLKVARRTPRANRRRFHVAFSPEREDPGNDTVARHDIPKVIGGCGPGAVELASAIYGSIFRRVIPVSSPAVAEMTKLLENIYRCVNIALVNELKQLCMRMGIDIHEVIDAANTKPFGFQAFYPGPGLGGHCIPIDPFYLSWKAKEFDFRTRFIELAGEVNTKMPYFVIEQTAAALNDQLASPSRVRRSWFSAWPTSATSTICASRLRSPSSSCSARKAPSSPTTIPISQPWAAAATTTST